MADPASSLSALLERLEAAATALAVERFGDKARRHGEVAQAIRALSDRYIGRDEGGGVRDEARLLAQLLFFTLADAPKSAFVVAELLRRGALPAAVDRGRAVRVLDVGAGCGAQSLGVALALASLADEGADADAADGDGGVSQAEDVPRRLEIDAVDADAEALSLMRSLLARVALPALEVELRDEVADLLGPAPRGPGGRGPGGRGRGALGAVFGRRRYDLVVAGSVFAELPAERHLELTRALLGRLAPGGALLIVEPALRETARALHRLRDAVLAERAAYVFAPCTHGAACPMLADERDWCHESRNYLGPPNLRQLASASGLRRRQLKWSYLTLRRERGNVAASPDAARVVSEALRTKGKREVFVCCSAGRVRLTRLDRDRGAANEALRDLDRGRLVELSRPWEAERMRIDTETEVRVVDPAGSLERELP
ncbi:MAG: hypothetical protein KC503_32985 [Myxococcales bacterium]|nr:hypothetical protein [Myxococcales bacterium]